MTIRNPEAAAQAALSTHVNVPRMCQAVTRNWFNAPSVGDVDGDGASDAEDGWKSEPLSARHEGDRRPPRGYPVAWGGGSSDNGHRAISLGPIDGVWMIRTTDGAGSGRTATVRLDFPEKAWGMPYLGWTETISGQKIPPNPVTKPSKPAPKPTRVSKARALLEDAHTKAVKRGQSKRAAALKKALSLVPKR